MDAFLTDNDADEVIELDDTCQPCENDEDDVHSGPSHESSPQGEDIENYDDDAQEDIDNESTISVFKEHKEPVLRVCLSRTRNFVVTGGQDDMAYVWETNTGKLLFSCPGHKDSVHCVDISCDETFVATGDMSGLVQVFDVTSGEKMFDNEVDDIQWMCWHPQSNCSLIVGTESGCIWLLNVLDVNEIKTLQGSAASTTAGKVTDCGTKLMTGYEDGSLHLWDLRNASNLFSVKGNLAHKSTVTCIAFRGEGQSISASGSTDGTVKLVNLLSGKVLTSFACGLSVSGSAFPSTKTSIDEHDEGGGEQNNSVESVAFCSGLPLVATATVGGVIEVWEVSSFQRRCSFLHDGGLSSIRWDLTDSTKIHSAGLDGTFNTWDGRDGQLVQQRYCHQDQILDFDLVHMEENSVLATASEDTTCRVFYMNKY